MDKASKKISGLRTWQSKEREKVIPTHHQQAGISEINGATRPNHNDKK